MSIVENLRNLLTKIPSNVKLIAVSKTKPAEQIAEIYNFGHKVFGENRAQELSEKYKILPKDIEWHMIGHLQTNKVKYIAPFVHLIHGVDSFKLLQFVDKEAAKCDRIINCLLQFHIAKEETKFGFDMLEAIQMLESSEYSDLQNINIVGLMGMATFTENTQLVRDEFKELVYIFNQLKSKYFSNKSDFKEISMGMSGDYKIAIEEGATLVRIGSLIFGER